MKDKGGKKYRYNVKKLVDDIEPEKCYHKVTYLDDFASKPHNYFFSETDFIAALDRYNHFT